MDYKKVCRTLSVSTLCAGILFTSMSSVHANSIKIMDGITLETIEYENEGLINPSQEEKQPLTWATFIRKMSSVSQTGEEEILQILKEGNKRYLPLVMTKAQVSHNYKTMLEFKNQGRLDSRNYSNIIKRVQAITPKRNYILNNEMDLLIREFNNYSVFNGVIREEMRGKLVDFEKDGKVTFDIVTQTGIQRRTFTLNPRSKWKVHNGMYRLVAEGDTLIVIDNSEVFKYGIVENSEEGLIIGENLITNLNYNVLAGDYIEYSVDEEGQAIVLNNLGRPQYKVVRSINNNGIVDTYQGSVDLLKLNMITESGTPTNLKSLKPFDLISIAGNTVIVSNTSKKVDIKLIGNTLIIEGMAYIMDDVILTDGLFVNKAEDWKYKDMVTSGDIVFDLEGNPKVIKIQSMENPGIAIGVGTTKVKLLSTGETEYEINPMIRTKINLDEIYNFIILDKEVVEADKIPTLKGTVSTLPNNFLQIGRKKYPVNSNTPVIIKVGLKEDTKTEVVNTSKGLDTLNYSKYEYKSIFYKDLLDMYKKEIGSGEMDLEIIEMYNQVGLIKVEFKPNFTLTKDNHLDTVEEYTIKTIEQVDTRNTLLTVSDGTNEAKLTYEGIVRYKEGDVVKLGFNRKGELINIR